MIKFFRKIRQNLVIENKTSRYFKYAIGEIILVMIGILLALQVSNWNENRKTRNQELELLKNLKLEMEQNSNLLDTYIDEKEISVNDITTLLSYTSPDYKEKEQDSIAFKLTKIFDLSNFKAEIMVLKAAQNSNAIKLIKNQKIKVGLSKWEQSLNGLKEFDVFGSEHFNTSLIPIISNYYPFVNIKSNKSNQDNSTISKHKSELEELFRSQDFENSIFRMQNFYRIRVSKAEDLKKNTDQIIQYLNKELNTNN